MKHYGFSNFGGYSLASFEVTRYPKSPDFGAVLKKKDSLSYSKN